MKLPALATLLLVVVACGPSPDAADPSDIDTDPTAGTGAPSAPSDGIIRDADGDGQPDAKGVDCGAMDETKCKINSGCAWTDEGTCVDGSLSPM